MQAALIGALDIPEELLLPEPMVAVALRYADIDGFCRWYVAFVSDGKDGRGLRELWEPREVTTSRYHCGPLPAVRLAALMERQGLLDMEDYSNPGEMSTGGVAIDVLLGRPERPDKRLHFWDAHLSRNGITRRFARWLARLAETLAHATPKWIAKNSR